MPQLSELTCRKKEERQQGEEATIRALGSEITFLCRQPGAWSLTRVSVPRDVGAPPHDHDFDEFLRACAWEITKTPEVLARLPEVGARHGIRIVPPSSRV